MFVKSGARRQRFNVLGALNAVTHELITVFLAYLERHWLRIPDYQAFQTQEITIGSGAVESTIKQISRRIKISGAQWKRDNLPQVLKHRCAYLNLA